jgi:hypothetical protein
VPVSTIVTATPGFATANNFAGACRDNQGNYWTSSIVGSQRLLVRISLSSLLVTAFVPMQSSAAVSDFAFDAQRSRLWASIGRDAHVYDVNTGTFLGVATSGLPSWSILGGITWNGSDPILRGNGGIAFDAQILQEIQAPGNQAYGIDIMLYPPSGLLWASANNPADPAQVTGCQFYEAGGGTTMPPHLIGASMPYGGFNLGCEQWFDPSSNEWYAVVRGGARA